MKRQSAITNFADKVKIASNRGNKDITLTMVEAVSFTSEVIALMDRESELLNQINELQKRLTEPTTIILNGGSF